MKGVLDGVRVVELGQVLAGPFAGAIFADLGADVIKVEKPDGGDDARRMGPDFRHGDALNFHEFNRGKKSVRSEERRVGKSVSVRVDLGGRRIIKKKKYDFL